MSSAAVVIGVLRLKYTYTVPKYAHIYAFAEASLEVKLHVC